MYEIEKGIPIPKPVKPQPPGVYPFKKMEVGDSFFIKCNKKERQRRSSSVLTLAKKTCNEMKFTTRFIQFGKHTGIRVWRIR